jgi:hypothetical protein
LQALYLCGVDIDAQTWEARSNEEGVVNFEYASLVVGESYVVEITELGEALGFDPDQRWETSYGIGGCVIETYGPCS